MRKTAYFTRGFAWVHAETLCFYEVLKPQRLKMDLLGTFGGYLDTGSILGRNLSDFWIPFGVPF